MSSKIMKIKKFSANLARNKKTVTYYNLELFRIAKLLDKYIAKKEIYINKKENIIRWDKVQKKMPQSKIE